MYCFFSFDFLNEQRRHWKRSSLLPVVKFIYTYTHKCKNVCVFKDQARDSLIKIIFLYMSYILHLLFYIKLFFCSLGATSSRDQVLLLDLWSDETWKLGGTYQIPEVEFRAVTCKTNAITSESSVPYIKLAWIIRINLYA